MTAQKMFKIDYSQFVVEGDNYAGFTGYRDKSVILMSEAEYKEWLTSQIERQNNFKIIKISTFTYKPAGELNIVTEVDNINEHIKKVNKEKEIKRLEAETAKMQEKLKALKKA